MPVARMHFEEELNRIHHDILVMGSRVQEDLSKAIEALQNRDEELARAVRADDAVINAMQIKIEDQVSVLIATQQPVARDLRELVATIKLLDHLERIGDYAAHLAKAAIKLRNADWPRELEIISRMGKLGCLMLEQVVAAFLNRDTEAARACAPLDSEVDALHKELIKSTLEAARESPGLIEEATKIIRLSVVLERLGDHVTNLCELVIYMVEGSHEELNG